MGINEASIFLTSTIMIVVAIVVAIGGMLIVNNMIYYWWKKLEWSIIPNAWKEIMSSRYTDEEFVDVSTKNVKTIKK